MKKFTGFLLFFVFLGIGGVWGQNTYTSAGNGDWNVPGTWTSSTGGTNYPIAGDTATIRAVDTVTLTAAANVDTLTNNGTVNLGTFVLTIPAAGLTNNGTIIFGGAGNANQLPNRTSITGTAVFRSTGTTLSTITSFTNLTIEAGARTGAGAVTVSGNFSITGGSLNATSINVTGTSNISANITTGTGTSQRYYQAVILGNDVILSGTGAAPVIRFDSTVDSDATPRSLTITNAAFQFRGNVGLTSRLSSVSNNYNAESRVLYGVYTTGDQTYSNGSNTNGSIRINSGANSDVIFHSSGTGSTITFAAITNTASRTLTITSDNVRFNGNVGANIALTSLTVNPSTGTIAINANVTTTGNQTYNGTIALGAATRTLTSSGGSVNAAGIISGTAGVTVRAAAGITMTAANTLTGTVTLNKTGAGTGAISYTSNHGAGNTVTIIAENSATTGGSIAINATTGNLNIGATSTATPAAPAGTIDITTTNGTINVTGAIGTAGNGAVTLTSSNSNQNITIGNTINCNSLTVSPGTGTIAINANVTTTGTAGQTYNGNVVLGAAVTLNATTATYPIVFGNTTTGRLSGNFALTINSGAATFNGTSSNIGALSVTGSATFQTAAFGAASVNVTGTSNINVGVTTTGTAGQTYNGNVVLGAAVTLNATTATYPIVFGNTGTGRLSGNFALTINSGAATFNGTSSNIGALSVTGSATFQTAVFGAASVVVNGNSNINADITTTVNTGYGQDYQGNVTLNAATVMLTGTAGSTVRFAGTVNSLNAGAANARNLTITNAHVEFNGVVGGGNALANLTVTGGEARINYNITTRGNQSYAAVVFGTGGTGVRTLTSSGGSISATGAASRTADTTAITINASQGIAMSGTSSFNGAGLVTLANNQTGTAPAGNISFSNSSTTLTLSVENTGNGTISITQGGGALILSTVTASNNITITASAGAITQITTPTPAIITTAGTLSLSSGGAITLNNSNSVNTLAITGAGGAVSFTNSNTINLSGISGASNSAVSLTASLNNINITAAVTCASLALSAINGTAVVSIGGNISVTSTSETHTNTASVYISAGTLTGSGNITLTGATGWVCAHLNTVLSFMGSVTGDRIHYHVPDGRNIVYTTSDTSTNLTGITNFFRVNANEINNSDIRLVTNADIYVVNIIDYTGTRAQINSRNVTFETTGTAANFIEFRQTNLLTGDLTLISNNNNNENIRLNNTVINRGGKTFDYNVLLTGSGNPNYSITAASIDLHTVTGAISDLSLTANAVTNGNVTFNNEIFPGVIRNLTVSATGTININQDITTTGTQNYNAVTLGGAGNTRTLQGTTVTLGAISGASKNLIINGAGTNNANAQFNGGSNIGALTVNGAAVFSAAMTTSIGSVSVTGSSTINTDITTTTTQSYGAIVLAAAVTTSRTLTGTTVTFGGGITGNNNTLIVNGHTANSADAHFNGAANNSIGVLTVNGVTTLGVTPIVFTGIGSATPASTITFGGAVNSNNSTARALTITNANVVFNGAVGASAALPITSVTVNATGAGNTAGYAQINADITTTGAQAYSGPVILNPVTGNNINFTAAGTGVTFSNTVTGNALAGTAPARGLIVTNANVTFGGTVGANNSIASIDVNAGSATINANITTTGNQNYVAVIFGAGGASPRTLTSSGGSISASGAVSRSGYNDAITVIANKGISLDNTSLNGSITLNNQGTAVANDITFRTSAAVTLAAVNTAASGQIKVNQTGTLTVASLQASGSVILGESNTVSVGAITNQNQTNGIITPSLTIRSSGAITLNNNAINNEVGSLLIERAAGAVNFRNNINLTIAGINGVANNNINITTTAGSITAGGNIDTTGTVALTSAGSITVNGNIANAATGTGIITLTSADDHDIVINTSATINGARVLLYAGAADTSTGTVNINGSVTARTTVGNTAHAANAAVYIRAGTFTGSGDIALTASDVCADLLELYSYSGTISNNRIHFHTRTNRHIAYGHGADNISHGKTNYLYINALLTNLGDVLGLTTTGAGEIYIIGRSSAVFPARDVTLTTAAGGLIEFIGNYQSAGSFTFSPASGIINLNNAQINLTNSVFTFNNPNSRLVLINSPSSSITATGINVNRISSLANNYALALTSTADGASGNILVNSAIGLSETNPVVYTALGNLSLESQNNGTIRLNAEVHSNAAVTINNSGLFTLASNAHITAGSFAKSGTGDSRIHADITATTNSSGTIAFNSIMNFAANIKLETVNSAINLVNVSGVQPGAFNLHLDSGTAAIGITGATEIYGSFRADCSSITSGGVMTVHGVTTMNNTGNFTLNANAEFKGNYTTGNNGVIASNANIVEIKFGANVSLGNVTLTNTASKIIFYHGAAVATVNQLNLTASSINIQSNVEILHGNTVKLVLGTVNQAAGRMLTLEAGQGSVHGAVLDVSAGSWFMGSGSAGQFSGTSGTLNLGGISDRDNRNTLSSRLIVNDLNLTGTNINNTGWAFIQIHGNVNITSFTVSLLPYLVLDMAGSDPNTSQTLTTNQTGDEFLGSLHTGVTSQTILASVENVITFKGEVIIKALSYPAGLVVNDLNIVMQAGLRGSRNLAAFTPGSTNDFDSPLANIYYSRWEISNAQYVDLPPFDSIPVLTNYVFRQNVGGKVSFKRDSGTDPVFFEVAGNTMWQTFECEEKGAVIQFSKDPHHHTVLGYFKIIGGETPGDKFDYTGYVMITRLTDNANHPFKYDYSIHGPPPGVSVASPHDIPAFHPPMNLKTNAAERVKFWNLNLVSNPVSTALEDFEFVSIYFSHAYNHRIPIDSDEMHLNVVPYYSTTDLNGYFNYDWIQLRKILYSFTEDWNGNGRLDRIRVQTNIPLNGDFTGFRARVDGYEIDTSKGAGGYELVSDKTGRDYDKDSFYIYVKELPDLYTGGLPEQTPLWHVVQNTSLRDSITQRSPVGDPSKDINIRPFDTIPPRVSHTLTLPNHNETYIRFSEPVVFDNVNVANNVLTLNGARAADAAVSGSYTYRWIYYDVDDNPRILRSLPIDSGYFGYLLNWQEYSPSGDAPYSLAKLLGIRDIADTPSSLSSPLLSDDGRYFSIENIEDQAQHAMDWRDPALGEPDDIFYLYYSSPKYPLNWGYTEYAHVSGNKHLAGTPDDPGFSDLDYEAYMEKPVPTIPLNTVFIPPYRALTVDMMKSLAEGNGSSITPQSFNTPGGGTVVRRITDVLVSIPPGSSSSNNYYVWPVWARYDNPVNPDEYRDTTGFYDRLITDTGVIWNFGGADGINVFLDYLGTKGNIDMQVRLGPGVPNTMLFDLFWSTNIPSIFRNPSAAPVQGRNTGGLWLPNNPEFYYITPALDTTITPPSKLVHSASSASPLFMFKFDNTTPYISGNKIEFVFQFSNNPPNTDMYIARLDIQPNAAIPSNWYHLVRPFGFDIRDMRQQRGGATILNNVINSNNGEVAYLRYQLVRPGRVTIQVYTLDGTLVKSIRRNEYREPGIWTDGWNGTNNAGLPVARGMYYMRIVAPDIDEIRQVMVVR